MTSYSCLVVTASLSALVFKIRRDFFGLEEVLANSGGHMVAMWPRRLVVRVPARGFLLVYYSSHRSKTHRFELGKLDSQTVGQTNGSQHCLMGDHLGLRG